MYSLFLRLGLGCCFCHPALDCSEEDTSSPLLFAFLNISDIEDELEGTLCDT